MTESASPSPLSKRSVLTIPLIAWATLLTMLGMTILVWRMTSISVEESAHNNFLQQSRDLVDAIEYRMLAYEQVLHGGVGLFMASDEVTRADWRAYVEALNIEKNYPGIQGIGYSMLVRPEQLAKHVADIQAEGFPDYSIKPDGMRDIYTAIVYLEPFDIRNRRAFGYDMFSNPIRREAMERARDTGEAALSGKVILKQEMSKDIQAGFLLYLPLYRKAAPLDTKAQRRAALLGYVYSPFRVGDLMHGILDDEKAVLNLTVFDGHSTQPDALMYDKRVDAWQGRKSDDALFGVSRTMNIQGRTWTLNISSTPLFESRIDTAKPLIVLVSGILISLLFTAFVWLLATRRERAMTLAGEMSEKARKSEALINAIVETAADGIITIDENGNILSFNQAAREIFGYQDEEVLGKNINMLMPGPYKNAHDQYLTNYFRTGEEKIIGIGREVHGRSKNGNIFPLELSISEVSLSGTRVFAGIVRDITQRKEAEMALRHSEARLRGLFELSPLGIALNDFETGAFLEVNDALIAPTGYNREEFLNLSYWDLTPKEYQAQEGEQLERLEKTGHYGPYEKEYIRKDGSRYPVVLNGIVIDNPTGKKMIWSIIEDITERKRIEKMKNEFISTVSHELRTPLTSIRGSIGLITSGATGVLPPQAKELLDIANRNSEQLLLLINDLLDIEKLQSGALSLQYEPCRVEKLVREAIEVNQGYADEFSVHFTIDSHCPDLLINVDPARFIQIMNNLLSNAAKFSSTGDEITVKITHLEDYARIEVTDNGPGIPEEFQAQVFDKFSQADSSDTRKKGGTGLGLNISRSLVEEMQGRIGFETYPGNGTTFWIMLPTWKQQ